MNTRVALVEIVEVGAFIAVRVIAVAMRAVEQEEVTALGRRGWIVW